MPQPDWTTTVDSDTQAPPSGPFQPLSLPSLLAPLPGSPLTPQPGTTSPRSQPLSSLEGPTPTVSVREVAQQVSHNSSEAPAEQEFVPIDDLSVEIPVDPDASYSAQIPLHTYHRRRKIDSVPRTDSSVTTTRSGRTPKLPPRLHDFYLHVAELAPAPSLPVSVDAALLHPG